MNILDINNPKESIEEFNTLSYKDQLTVAIRSLNDSVSYDEEWLNTFKEVLTPYIKEIKSVNIKGLSVEEEVELIMNKKLQ